MLPSDPELHDFMRWVYRREHRIHVRQGDMALAYSQATGVGLSHARDCVERALVEHYIKLTTPKGHPLERIPDRTASPHRQYPSGCSRCHVRWPCRSVALGTDAEPAAAGYADWADIGTTGRVMAEVAAERLIRDSGRRRGWQKRIVWISGPGVDSARIDSRRAGCESVHLGGSR